MEFCEYCRVDFSNAEGYHHGPNCPRYFPGADASESDSDIAEQLAEINQRLERIETKLGAKVPMLCVRVAIEKLAPAYGIEDVTAFVQDVERFVGAKR